MTEPRKTRRPAITCRVRKVNIIGKWACVVHHHGKPVECKHFPTWADAYRHAWERV